MLLACCSCCTTNAPCAAFAGYAEYSVQGARSGLLPASYLGNTAYQYTNCIGLFAYYDNATAFASPKVNPALTSLGYNVGAGGKP